tara:strand:+ start:609 stop:1358 length:750 start_codon:yes stop_codon:yes gene_type:complete
MLELSQEGVEPDVLFWVGSAGSFDDRAKKITRAFVKILNKANIIFGVLGQEESSSGDPAKRAGNEFLFQMQAMSNIEILNSYNVKNIVTACPHDYNTIKNEYPELGGRYNVKHHTEFIEELIDDGKLKLSKDLKKKVTFHDPCYLGRGNKVYNAPRNLIEKMKADSYEMPRNKKNSLCCGAGGGQMFKDAENGSKEINIERTDEALKLEPDIIITACPFCNIMMTDGVKLIKEGSSQVMDIAELIAEQI